MLRLDKAKIKIIRSMRTTPPCSLLSQLKISHHLFSFYSLLIINCNETKQEIREACFHFVPLPSFISSFVTF